MASWRSSPSALQDQGQRAEGKKLDVSHLPPTPHPPPLSLQSLIDTLHFTLRLN